MILGIDLGTTYSAAAYMDASGKPRIVTNMEGDTTTPSVVLVEGDQVIVGKVAKRKAILLFQNICSRVKSLMGFRKTALKSGQEEYSPEMISHFILKKLIQDAEKRLGEKVTGIVVTVPSNFTDAQRKATEDAARFTGVRLVGMVDEPTAAALYYHSTAEKKEGVVLVYDFGGGTCDVTLMQMKDSNIRILQKAGAPETGGAYFDDFILEMVIEKVNEQFGVDLNEEKYEVTRRDILNDAEDCKKELSVSETSSIMVRADDLREEIVITRAEFEKRIRRMFNRTRSLIDEVLVSEGIGPEAVDRVLMVGGSSRIPFVQRSLEKYFGKELNYEIDPDEAVALGAAVYGSLMEETEQEQTTGIQLEDVCSHGIGILLYKENSTEQYNDIVIEKGTKIPCRITKKYGTSVADQRMIHLTLTEGEYEDLEFIHTIGESDIDLPPGLPGNTQVDITIALDERQLVHVYVQIPSVNVNKEFAIRRQANYTEEELRRMTGGADDAQLLACVGSLMKNDMDDERLRSDAKEPYGRNGAAEKPCQSPVREKPEKKSLLKLFGEKAVKRRERTVLLSVDENFKDIIGMKPAREVISNLCSSFRVQDALGGGQKSLLPWNFMIGGESGSGKKKLAYVLCEILYQMKMVSRKIPVEMDALAVCASPDILQEAIQKTPGIFLITHAEAMCGKKEKEGDSEADKEEIWHLLKEYLKQSVETQEYFFIFCGEVDTLEEFWDRKPELSVFMNWLKIPPYSNDELFEMGANMFREVGFSFTEEAETRFRKLIRRESVAADFANYYSLKRLYQETIKNVSQRSQDGEDAARLRLLVAEDFMMDDQQEETTEELLARLDGMIGLESVKNDIRSKIALISRMDKKKQESVITLHTLFLGAAGTGKTTVAQLLGRLYGSLGLLPRSDVFVSVTRADLVGKYQGHTAQAVREVVKRAMGGVLFIDEAYDLVNDDNDTFGKEALNALVAYAWDYRDRLMIIMAGYEGKMKKLLTYNEGMERRFPNKLHFEDYSKDELYEIFCYQVRQANLMIDPGAESAIRDLIAKKSRSTNFGNAGGVQNIVDGMLTAVSVRESREDRPYDEVSTITTEDVAYYSGNLNEKEKELDDYLEELDHMIGLAAVKEEVRKRIELLKMEKRRQEKEIIGSGSHNYHTLLLGPPGTGKTSVARLLAKIYYKLGLLDDVFVEIDGRGLVEGYSGQTASKAHQVIDSAMGGVLFIDEAYNMINGQQDSFGQEAVATLMKVAEDRKGDFMLILAGYENEMMELLSLNPGMDRRFPNRLYFESYTPEELYEIFQLMLRRNQYQLEESARDVFMELLEVRRNSLAAGNAGAVENILMEEIIPVMARRLAHIESPGKQELTLILRSDIEQVLERTTCR